MKEIYVLGNGASLKDFDFNLLKDKEWIGCCLAYRYWKETNIYPTHYVNVDRVVLKHNLADIQDLIINKKCKTFLLSASIIKEWSDIVNYKNVYFIEQFKSQSGNPFRNLIDYCSGSSASTYAYLLDADVIHLLGMDCNYVEFIPECIRLNDGTLKIIKQPQNNPNYFFNGYQQVGDIYNPPNTERIHKESWQDLRNLMILFNILRQKDIMIYNYNDNDTLDNFFHRKSLDELKNM
tara:strand:- start:3232 stop:3939 length:708 start_codon:yes stop_codon:yes gene_type:complete